MRLLIASTSMSAADAAAEAALQNCDGFHHGIPPKLTGVYTEADLPVVHDSVPAIASLDDYKAEVCALIDARTATNIVDGDGFEYTIDATPRRFSLSDRAQTKWVGLEVGKDLIDYANDPPKVPTKDDSFVYEVPDAATVSQMYGTALATVKALLDAGLTVKEAVVAVPDTGDPAVDKAAVDAAAAAYLS